jgi:hypothetical protein
MNRPIVLAWSGTRPLTPRSIELTPVAPRGAGTKLPLSLFLERDFSFGEQ